MSALLITLAIIYMLFIWSLLRIASKPTPKITKGVGEDEQVHGQKLVMQNKRNVTQSYTR